MKKHNDKNVKKIGINYMYNLLYQMIAILTPLILTPYLSRVLGPNKIGTYSFAFSIVNYFSIFATLGINIYGKIVIASEDKNEVNISKNFYEIFYARLITSSLVVIVYLVYLKFFVNYDFKIIFYILSLNIISGIFDITWFFHGIELFKITVQKALFAKLINVILIFTFVKNEQDIIIYTLIMQISIFFGLIILWANLNKYIIKCKVTFSKIVFRIRNSAVYFISTISIAIYSYIDKTMLGLLSIDLQEVGYYTQALKIQNVIMTLIASLSMVILPRMAFLFANKNENIIEIRKIINEAIRFTLMLAIPMSLGVIIVSDELVPLFLGDKFIPSIQILKILSFLAVFSGLNSIFGQMILVASKRQKEFNIIRISGTIVNLVLNFIMINKLGAVGAAFASIISEIFVFLLLINTCRQYILKNILKEVLNYILGSVFMLILILITKLLFNLENSFMNIIFTVVVGGSTYFMYLIIVQDSLLYKLKNRYIK